MPTTAYAITVTPPSVGGYAAPVAVRFEDAAAPGASPFANRPSLTLNGSLIGDSDETLISDVTTFYFIAATAVNLHAKVNGDDVDHRLNLVPLAYASPLAIALQPTSSGADLPDLASQYQMLGGNTLGIIGDSIVAASGSGVWIDVLSMVSGARFTVVVNAGVGGNTSTQMLARIATDLIAYAPEWGVCQVTPNDQGQGVSIATSIANYKAMVAMLRAARIRPIIALGPTNDTTATRDQLLATNVALAAWCETEGIPTFILFDPLADPADGTYLAAYQSDGTHPTSAGIAAIAAWNLPRVPAEMVRSATLLAVSPTDSYNLIVNGTFQTDTNADGLSDNWSKSGTAVCTRTAITAGLGHGYWQNIAPSDTTTTSVYQDITTVVGRTYEVAVRVKSATSGMRLRTPWGDAPLTNNNTLIYDRSEADGAIIVRRGVATSSTSRIHLTAGGAAGMVSFGQVTVRDRTAIAALG